jgi:hypothetical protein
MTSTPSIDIHCLLQCNPAQLVLENLHDPNTLRELDHFASQLQHYLQLANRDLAEQQRGHEVEPDGIISTEEMDARQSQVQNPTTGEAYAVRIKQESQEENPSAEDPSGDCYPDDPDDDPPETTDIPVDNKLANIHLHPDLSEELSRLSKYHRLLLANVELFRNPTSYDHPKNGQHFEEGQLGYRCRYCWTINPAPRFFPNSLNRMVNAMSVICVRHLFSGQCTEIPLDIKEGLIRAKIQNKEERYKKSTLAFYLFLEKMCHLHGIVETELGGLKLQSDLAKEEVSAPVSARGREGKLDSSSQKPATGKRKKKGKVESIAGSPKTAAEATGKRESGQDPQGRHPLEPAGKRLCSSHNS